MNRSFTAELREACGYDDVSETGIDSLIEYKNALEDLVDRLDELMHAAAGRGEYTPSGADIAAALWSMGLGADPVGAT